MEIEKGYYHLAKSWYADACLKNSKYLDEVMFGLYLANGEGVIGEMAIRWYNLGDSYSQIPRLEVFFDSDGINVLQELSGVIAELSRFSDGAFTPNEFCKFLDSNGFKDFSPIKRK